jgi:hypothetical protein
MRNAAQPEEAPASSARSAVIFAGFALLSVLLAAGWWAKRTWTATQALREAEALAARAEADVDPPPLLESPAGSVRLMVVDGRSGLPLEGIEVELLCDEPLRRRFGVQRSDANGALHFEAVYAPRVLALARRDERFADTLTLVAGDAARERRGLLRMGSGGRLRGRVVDDLGTPIAGAQLSLPDISPWPDPARPAVSVGESGADGSFVIERIANVPRSITPREDQSHYAAALTHVQVEAQYHGSSARVPCSLNACDDARIADLVLARAPSFSGRVLDAQRRPLSGVLLSLNPRRALLSQPNWNPSDPAALAEGVADLPGSPRFALLEAEALTNADGSFLLSATPRRATLLVACADGRLQDVPLSAWSPGELSAELEIVLDEREVLRLRLFDSEGRPILGAERAVARRDGERGARILPVDGPKQAAWANSKVELSATLVDDRASASCGP